MAKGTHNKTHKRNQSIIRRLMQDKVYTPRTNAIHERLLKRTLGQGDDSLITRKKNAFRYPNDPNAIFPQEEKPVYIDRRSMNLPTEYLKKEIYEKKKNKYARERDEKLKNELLRIDGKLNENKNIELGDMEDIPMDEDKEENNKKESKIFNKEKETGMILDDDYKNIRKNRKKINRGGFKHKRRSKHIMNFK